MIFEDGDLEGILDYGAERSWVEFKSPGPLTDKRLVARVIRAMLAMANTREGGLIVVGVREDKGRFEAVGLSPEELETWSDEDAFADKVAAYADPPVRYRLHRPQVQSHTFVAINVEEFDREPLICRKDYPGVLAEGALYSRPRRKPESSPVRTPADMRDLLRLAADKRLRDFLARAQAGGLAIGATDGARFDDQLLASSPEPAVTAEIEGRGHWLVTVRPSDFDRGRVPFDDLESIVRDAAVTVGGWDFPHVEFQRAPIRRDVDCVGQGHSWYGNIEVWRIWTSGQFSSKRAMREDWTERTAYPKWHGPVPGTVLLVLQALICYWEAYEFAARLALTPAGGPEMQISVTVRGLQGRRLLMDARRPPFDSVFQASLAEYPDVVDLPTTELVANPQRLAVRAASSLFLRFGWSPDEESLNAILDDFRRRRQP